jgi:hypothetical protein
MTIHVRYRLPPAEPVIISFNEAKADPFDICEKARAQIFPDEKPPEVDVKLQKIMQERKRAPVKPVATEPVSGPATARQSATALQGGIEGSNPSGSTNGVRSTSLDAYRALRASGELTAQQKLVLAAIASEKQPDWTRQELSKATGLGVNVICGRVNELLKPPLQCVVEGDRRRCNITGESAHPLRLEVAWVKEKAA